MSEDQKKPVNLRSVADRVGLAPCSVSAVLNGTPASQSIPQATKDRIFRAANELNYRPNLWARSLRTKRTKVIAAVTPDFGRGRVAQVVAGLQSRLHEKGYLLALATDGCGDDNQFWSQFRQRGIEGVVAIDVALPEECDLPIASVDLGYVSSAEGEMRPWLSSMGKAAADMIVRQIETPGLNRRLTVDAKMSSAYFDVSGAHSGLEARDSA